MSETRSYNTDNTLASISYSGASIGMLSYGWNDNKNKTSESISGTMSNYGFSVGTSGYDNEDRLVAWNRTSGLDQSWDLSLVGDWNSITENSSTQYRTHGDAHELLTADSQSLQHDVKGNQTLIPAVLRPNSTDPLALTWDFDNRLSSADVDNDSVADVTYQFDALGRRVGRDDGTSAMVYVQSGQQTIADYGSGVAATSPTYNYVYASYIDEPVLRDDGTNLRYFHRNQQYSITAVTDASGAIVERYAYTAYGALSVFDGSGTVLTASAEDNRYTYTGREWDEVLGLYHYRARMYDATEGRFLGRDPIGYIDTYALYVYLRNNPESAVDPMGLKTVRLVSATGARRYLPFSSTVTWVLDDAETRKIEELEETIEEIDQLIQELASLDCPKCQIDISAYQSLLTAKRDAENYRQAILDWDPATDPLVMSESLGGRFINGATWTFDFQQYETGNPSPDRKLREIAAPLWRCLELATGRARGAPIRPALGGSGGGGGGPPPKPPKVQPPQQPPSPTIQHTPPPVPRNRRKLQFETLEQRRLQGKKWWHWLSSNPLTRASDEARALRLPAATTKDEISRSPVDAVAGDLLEQGPDHLYSNLVTQKPSPRQFSIKNCLVAKASRKEPSIFLESSFVSVSFRRDPTSCATEDS